MYENWYGFKTWVTKECQNMGNTFMLQISQSKEEIDNAMEGDQCNGSAKRFYDESIKEQ